MTAPYQHPLNWQKAVAKLILDHPFFATLYLRLKVSPEPRIETAGINNKQLLYNPDWVAKFSVNELVFILAHEIMHLAMMHPMRLGARNPEKANVAGDYAINLILKDCNLTMPNEGLIDQKYRTPEGNVLAMEQIYTRLGEDEEPEDGEGKGEKDGKGEGEGGGGGQGQGEGEGEGEGEGDGEGEGEGEGTGGQQGQGQGQGGGSAPNVPDKGKCGGFFAAENEEGDKASAAESAREEAEMNVAVQQAAQAAKSCGKLPASLKELVEEMANPVMDWREVLRNFMQKTAKDSYDWSVANRRHIANGLYLPSRRSDELKPIMVAFDNSGSVSNEEIAMFAGELNDILSSMPCTVTTVEFDTDIVRDHVETYTEDDYPVKLERVRCGGTAFAPVFDYAEELAMENGEEWAAVVVMTDMCAPMPDNEPHCPVLWVSTRKTYREPEFGEVAVIADV
jgi:predicted metal-dependent peptidase